MQVNLFLRYTLDSDGPKLPSHLSQESPFLELQWHLLSYWPKQSFLARTQNKKVHSNGDLMQSCHQQNESNYNLDRFLFILFSQFYIWNVLFSFIAADKSTTEKMKYESYVIYERCQSNVACVVATLVSILRRWP